MSIFSIVSGVLAVSFWFFQTSYQDVLLGAIFFHLKDLFDATDGPVARMSQREHPIWRYVDTLGDGLILSLVMAVIGYISFKSNESLSLVFFSWISLFLQCSYWAYYQQKVIEAFNLSAMSMNFQDKFNPKMEEIKCSTPLQVVFLRILQQLYRIFFGWQDALIKRLDRWIYVDQYGETWFSNRTFLSLQSLLCFGTHIFIIWSLFLLKKVSWIPYVIGIWMNLYLLLLILCRILYFKIKKHGRWRWKKI